MTPPLSRPATGLGLLALGLVAPALGGSTPTQEVDYERDVVPILEQRCVSCHGEEKQRAGLRLDSRSAVLSGSDSGEIQVVVPGDPEGSLLLELVASDDEDERMPPKGEPLTAEQIDLLRRWIEEGAQGPAEESTREKHWAYVPPVRPELPAPRGAEWARGALDLFVLARLEADGLAPSPEADLRTLARRAHLDLVGLPPSPEELDAFLADTEPGAYERLVDRLLASPHYGERMAQRWLDLARYADTNGYETDARRTMWRWRDWVIEAFNADMPFDQFTIEQLAGDLLPEPTLEQQIATGFHRNTMVNAEGGVDQEEYRVAAVVDRVNTTATVWLATTMSCAQCHEHKYDPLSHRDYYRLFAYFNSSEDVGPSVRPTIPAPRREQAAEEERLAAETSELEAALSAWTPELEQELARLRDEHVGASALPAHRVLEASAEEGSTLSLVFEDGSILATGEAPARDTYLLELELTEARTLRGVQLDVLVGGNEDERGPGRTEHGNFVLNELSAQLVTTDGERELAFAGARADHHQVGSPVWAPGDAVDGDPQSGWAVGGGEGRPHRLEAALAESLQVPAGARLRLRLQQTFGSQHVLGRFRVELLDQLTPDDAPLLAPDVESWLAAGAEELTEEESERLREWFLAGTSALAPQRDRLAELRARPKPPTALVMRERAVPRETHVLARGSFLSPGDLVEPDVPAVLGELPADALPNRLGLARWLVSPQNPLTARVTINRLWDQVFGRGLVHTLEDFGTQGARPSHPELLDWLALELQEDGWSLKRALRRIVTSSTYRQSSNVSPQLAAHDPENALLARSPRYRVEAEMVRDLALAASGLLTEKLGGPSVMPPQPEGIWMATYSGDRWQADEDEDRFRRGLYTFWRRTSPYPTFMTFDAPSRELVCTRRPGSNTPLQALALLNDPVFVEAAVALAARMLRIPEATDEQRLRHGLELCTTREGSADELAVLSQLLTAERATYAADPEAARALLERGVDLGTGDLDPLELAAWTLVANVLLNLDETVTRG